MSLFDRPAKEFERHGHEPLAARMRPRSLDEFWGQSHILAKGRLLRRAIEADQLSSVIFYGPPGTGKTTLARIIANTTQSKFLSLNAVLSGVKEIRESIESAKQNFAFMDRKCILFVDEVHRFNKSQQDALLPWVENGTITLIGATTENPYFEVNKALVSRSRIFQLVSLTQDELRGIAQSCLRDPDRGYGLMPIVMRDDALDHLVNVANGDARALLNALELAVTTTPPNETGQIDISLSVAEESIQQRAVLYDKEGDAHFDTISAFIKSIRGSDPDAALYWLARMVQAGESPNFILRRLIISACEDVGLADPTALSVVMACAQAFDRVGLPEGRYHLAHATLYLATAPKSNSSMAFFDALSVVQKESSYDVPNHLKDGSRDKEGLGHGEGYLYPHAYRDHWVAQQYLPTGLQGRIFYNPSNCGYESKIYDDVMANRESQLASFEEQVLASSQTKLSDERWIGRSFDGGAKRAQAIRDEIFSALELAPNARVLDLNASSGLLSYEALRRCPDGGVYSILTPSKSADDFEALMSTRPILERATILHCQQIEHFLQGDGPDVQFDAIIGRNFLHICDDLTTVLENIAKRLAPNGRCIIANILPSANLRLSSFADEKQPKQGGSAHSNEAWRKAWRQAEAKLLKAEKGMDFGEDSLGKAFEKLGKSFHIRRLELDGKMTITDGVFRHWFESDQNEPSYIDKLGQHLTAESCSAIVQWAQLSLKGRAVEWPYVVLLIAF